MTTTLDLDLGFIFFFVFLILVNFCKSILIYQSILIYKLTFNLNKKKFDLLTKKKYLFIFIFSISFIFDIFKKLKITT